MRLPIRNKSNRALTIFIEPVCDQFEIPVGGEAIIRLEDGLPHSIEIDDGWVTIWDEGVDARVEIVSRSDMRIDDALRLARTWLHRLGAESEGLLIDDTVDDLEIAAGYFGARVQVFGAFHEGFSAGDAAPPIGDAHGIGWKNQNLAACYRAGVTAARLNRVAREAKAFPELGAAPFDTETVRSAFACALAAVGSPP